MTTYEIPLTPSPQRLSIILTGKLYRLTVKWNVSSQCWMLDIADANNNQLLAGIPIVTGCDLLEQYDYLNFGGSLVALTDHDSDIPPDFKNLGTTGHLYWITNG